VAPALRFNPILIDSPKRLDIAVHAHF
jgi:hypothetical protein